MQGGDKEVEFGRGIRNDLANTLEEMDIESQFLHLAPAPGKMLETKSF